MALYFVPVIISSKQNLIPFILALIFIHLPIEKWVETCVRPREGLTRAMLEMYMQDGGTLGDVLQALLQLECMDILESVRPRVETFLDERSRRNNANLTSSQER